MTTPSTWNIFVKAHAKKGYNMTQLAKMYRTQDKKPVPRPRPTKVTPVPRPRKPADPTKKRLRHRCPDGSKRVCQRPDGTFVKITYR